MSPQLMQTERKVVQRFVVVFVFFTKRYFSLLESSEAEQRFLKNTTRGRHASLSSSASQTVTDCGLTVSNSFLLFNYVLRRKKRGTL